MFIRKYWIPILVFLVAITGSTVYWLKTQTPLEPIKRYTVSDTLKTPTDTPTETSKTEISTETETGQSGHWHSNEWHPEPHQPTISPAPTSSVADTQYTPTEVTQAGMLQEDIDAARENALYREQLRQYHEARNQWWERNDDLHKRIMQHYEKGQKLSPSVSEMGVEAYIEYVKEIRSLPEAEKNKIKAAYDAHLEKLEALQKEAKVLQQEKPVPPTPPQNN